MPIRVFLVASYMLICTLIGTKPCKYFQLNSRWFDGDRGLFSKQDIDLMIPERWRLDQRVDSPDIVPERWPVFVKPEWGQNAAGVHRADNPEQLARIRHEISQSRVRYLLQAGATERREFEVFWIRSAAGERPAVMTISEAINSREENPVNSIRNPDTHYTEITDHFSADQRDQLWGLMQEFGVLNIARASLRADSEQDLISGNFHVIEINLFVPMPINLLDPRYTLFRKLKLILGYVLALARITRARDKTLPEKAVFIKMMLYNRESRILNYLRTKI